MDPVLNYYRCPIHSQTFQVKKIKSWVEKTCEGKTLNLFAGTTVLSIDEVRNDKDEEAVAEYHMDAIDFCDSWNGSSFNTILMDPHILIVKVWSFITETFAVHSNC